MPLDGTRMIAPPNFAPNVYLTRMHLRYTAQSHPEDLAFAISDDREKLSRRYILQRPFTGEITFVKLVRIMSLR
ncbi:MAG: hypothetical protein R2865_11410 [Deinococcales bacterium]